MAQQSTRTANINDIQRSRRGIIASLRQFITLLDIYSTSTMSSYHLSTYSLRVRMPQFFMHSGIRSRVLSSLQNCALILNSLVGHGFYLLHFVFLHQKWSISCFHYPNATVLGDGVLLTNRGSTCIFGLLLLPAPPAVFSIALLLFHCLLCSGTVPRCEGL